MGSSRRRPSCGRREFFRCYTALGHKLRIFEKAGSAIPWHRPPHLHRTARVAVQVGQVCDRGYYIFVTNSETSIDQSRLRNKFAGGFASEFPIGNLLGSEESLQLNFATFVTEIHEGKRDNMK